MQKRIDAILKNNPTQVKVSDPVPYVSKNWISPLKSKDQNAPFHHDKVRKQIKTVQKSEEKQQVKKIYTVLDLNKKLKYFGEYLQVENQGQHKRVQIAHIQEHDSKMQYLKKKMAEIEKAIKPKMCILNFSLQEKLTFINYLEQDEFYQNVIRKYD